MKNVLRIKTLFSENFVNFEKESNKIVSARLNEVSEDVRIVVNPPFPAMSEEEVGRVI